MRRPLVPVSAVLVAVLVAGLAACSEKTAGTAVAGDETGQSQESTAPETSSQSEEPSATEPDSPLADVKPCDLLTTQGATALKVDAGQERQVGEARTCRWRVEGATLDDSFTLDLGLYDERGIDDVSGTNIQQKTIGSHDAVTFTDATGGCIVSIATGESSRADSLASGGDVQRGCQLAAQLADLVEPQLP